MTLRVVLPRLVLFLAGVVMIACGHLLSPGVAAGSSADTADQTMVVPSWTPADAARYPACTPAAAWPAGRAAPYVVVQAVRDGGHSKIGFDRAWRLNHNATEVDDLWVLGVCG